MIGSGSATWPSFLETLGNLGVVLYLIITRQVFVYVTKAMLADAGQSRGLSLVAPRTLALTSQ